MTETGIAPEAMRAIFLTHLHPDHALGLAAVLADDFQHRDHRDPTRPLAVYGPSQTQALVNAAWTYISIPYTVFAVEQMANVGTDMSKTSPFDAHEIDTGVVYHDDLIRVVAVENSHGIDPGTASVMKI